MRVPDYVEPTVGWRIWDVVEADGGLRLCSVAFRTIWSPRRKAVALCRRSPKNFAWTGLSPHSAPNERCSCGVYAAQTAGQVAVYFTRPFLWRWSAVHRVLGTVSLWGEVVESTLGWRAAYAYPRAIFVPAPRRGLRSFLSGMPRPRVPAEAVALALADYGVPVDVIDCATGAELASLVGPGPAERGRAYLST